LGTGLVAGEASLTTGGEVKVVDLIKVDLIKTSEVKVLDMTGILEVKGVD
jgi:hypothetical protein